MEEDLETYNNREVYSTPMALTYIIVGIISTPITIIVLYSTLKLFKKKTSIDLKISLGVLIIDFVISIGMVIQGLMTKYNGLYIVYNKWYCSFTTLFYINQAYVSVFYVGLMSLERGLLIMHNIRLPDMFWITIMLGEFFYFLILSSVGIHLGQIGLITLVYACMLTPNFQLGIIVTWSFFIMMALNFSCMLYCYLGIAIKLRLNAWKNIRELNLNKETTLRQANRTILKVVTLLIFYIGANGLELVNFIIEITTGVTRPGLNDYISTSLMTLGPIVNSIILIQFHDPVKISLLNTLPFLNFIFKHNPETSLNQNHHNNSR